MPFNPLDYIAAVIGVIAGAVIAARRLHVQRADRDLLRRQDRR